MPSVTSEISSRPLSLNYEEIVRDFRNSEMQYLRHLNMILKVCLPCFLKFHHTFAVCYFFKYK